jgi:hypothetical protein
MSNGTETPPPETPTQHVVLMASLQYDFLELYLTPVFDVIPPH